MLISEKHKFIFIAVGRAGSTSIYQALEHFAHEYQFDGCDQPIYSNGGLKHIPAIFAREKVKDWDSYFKFCFVRHPFTWVISQLFFNNFCKFGDSVTPRKILEVADYLAKHCHRGITWERYPTQAGRIQDRDRKILVDYVGRFENFKTDFDIICQKVGIGQIHLPKTNSSKHKDPKQYFTKDIADLISCLWEKDYKAFNYDPNNIGII